MYTDGPETIRESPLKLPGNLLYPMHASQIKTPPTLNIMSPDDEYHLEMNHDCRKVARGTQSMFSCLCSY